MPKGPKGQNRPADVIGMSVTVAKIATGELVEAPDGTSHAPQRDGGKVGGRCRAEKLSPERRSEIARQAAQMRWKKDA